MNRGRRAGEHLSNGGRKRAQPGKQLRRAPYCWGVPETSPTPFDAGAPALPPGAEAVLSALRSAWVVLDGRDRVVRSSPSALPYGLIRGSRLRVDTLVLLARQVRRDGEVRELEIEVPRGHRGTELLVLDVRLAPLGDHVLLLAEDQTAVRRLDAVRRDFVANVSHELKTPVGAFVVVG